MKRIIPLILVFTILLSLSIPVSAAVKDEVMPLYNEIDTVSAGLTINKTLGITTCTGRVTAKELVPVKVVVSLQVYKEGRWQTLQSWSETGTLTASTTHKYAVYSGYQYRVYTIGYVYNSEGVIQESASAIQVVNYP